MTLKFEFPHKQEEITPLILSENPLDRERGIALLTNNDRVLEEYLSTIGGGGISTAQSIIAEYDIETSVNGPGNLSGQPHMSFDVPADPAFNYFLDWRLHVNGYVITSGAGIDVQTSAYIYGQSPGAGYEDWGISTTVPDGVTSGVSYLGRMAFSGTGGRIDAIDSSLLGTTPYLNIDYSFSAAGGTNWTGSVRASALLIAIPV